MGNKITSRKEDYSKWYNDIVINADLAENSDIRGCMVIKPYGFSIWELMKKELDKMFKDTGHENAYFPLFIPKSLFIIIKLCHFIPTRIVKFLNKFIF